MLPFFTPKAAFYPNGNLLRSICDQSDQQYTYDPLNQLISEEPHIYVYDSLYNRIEKNQKTYQVNELNELDCCYGINGNQELKQTPTETFRLIYDPLNRLIEAKSSEKKISFTYDPLGRRLSKTVYIDDKETSLERYLYDGSNEIGSLGPDNTLKNLKVLGLAKHRNNPLPVALELNGKTYAPILDVQGNVRRLVEVKSKAIALAEDFTAFGEEMRVEGSLFNPWRFATKRYDPELDLVYFGKRDYNPALGRWLQTDPAGFVDGINPYQYIFNNPFLFTDPDGRFAFVIPLLIWGAEVAVPTLSAIAAPVVYGAIAGAVAYGGYKIAQEVNAHDQHKYSVENNQSMPGDLDTVNKMQRKKKGDIDSNLSTDPLNDPNLEDVSDARAKEQGRYKLKDRRTGEIIEFDKGKPGKEGHKSYDHYHRPNPNKTGKGDYYLDSKGNPVPKGSETSHLYPPEWVWWE